MRTKKTLNQSIFGAPKNKNYKHKESTAAYFKKIGEASKEQERSNCLMKIIRKPVSKQSLSSNKKATSMSVAGGPGPKSKI